MAYGAAKFAPGGAGVVCELSVPTCRAFKECATRFRCLLVDEFRTTQTDHEDGTHLQKVAVPSDPKLVGRAGPAPKRAHMHVVRGLLWCGSTSDNGKFVNRDMNAAINIRRCAVQAQRPRWLQRRPGQAPLPPQMVAKIIPW